MELPNYGDRFAGWNNVCESNTLAARILLANRTFLVCRTLLQASPSASAIGRQKHARPAFSALRFAPKPAWLCKFVPTQTPNRMADAIPIFALEIGYAIRDNHSMSPPILQRTINRSQNAHMQIPESLTPQENLLFLSQYDTWMRNSRPRGERRKWQAITCPSEKSERLCRS